MSALSAWKSWFSSMIQFAAHNLTHKTSPLTELQIAMGFIANVAPEGTDLDASITIPISFSVNLPTEWAELAETPATVTYDTSVTVSLLTFVKPLQACWEGACDALLEKVRYEFMKELASTQLDLYIFGGRERQRHEKPMSIPPYLFRATLNGDRPHSFSANVTVSYDIANVYEILSL